MKAVAEVFFQHGVTSTYDSRIRAPRGSPAAFAHARRAEKKKTCADRPRNTHAHIAAKRHKRHIQPDYSRKSLMYNRLSL